MALLPAHDEEATLPAALASLAAQTRRPDRVVVVADNCTDRTEDVARAGGAEVFRTVGNTQKKAGALNQVLAGLLPGLSDEDLVLVMDADSLLDPGFLAAARARLAGSGPRHHLHRRGLGGVGGTFRGGPGGGLVGMFQRNEYARYARDVRRLQGKALVLTGTASVFPARVLREVQQARAAGALPDKSGAGAVYDTHVLTEDNELSLALMHLGYRILAPAECTLETEVMTSWSDLARQRVRWKRGAVENLVDYRLTRVTAPYWGRQALAALGVLATFLYLASLVWGLLSGLTAAPLLARGIRDLRPRTCRDRPTSGLAADAARRPARRRDGLRPLSSAGAGPSACPGPTASREEVVTMYNNPGAAAGGGVLAATGLAGGNFLWAFLAAFALIALGMAVMRTIPRRES